MVKFLSVWIVVFFYGDARAACSENYVCVLDGAHLEFNFNLVELPGHRYFKSMRCVHEDSIGKCMLKHETYRRVNPNNCLPRHQTPKRHPQWGPVEYIEACHLTHDEKSTG